jgi:hypothetical protein
MMAEGVVVNDGDHYFTTAEDIIGTAEKFYEI